MLSLLQATPADDLLTSVTVFISYLAFPVVGEGQVVVGSTILRVVVEIGVEIREVAVQVHPVCIVPTNQIPRRVWALGEIERGEMSVSDRVLYFKSVV